MSEVRVKVIEGFKDRTDELKYKEKDTILEVSEERAKKLIGLGLVEQVIENQEQTEGEESKKTKGKQKSK